MNTSIDSVNIILHQIAFQTLPGYDVTDIGMENILGNLKNVRKDTVSFIITNNMNTFTVT